MRVPPSANEREQMKRFEPKIEHYEVRGSLDLYFESNISLADARTIATFSAKRSGLGSQVSLVLVNRVPAVDDLYYVVVNGDKAVFLLVRKRDQL
jgi:hypothetical protein